MEGRLPVVCLCMCERAKEGHCGNRRKCGGDLPKNKIVSALAICIPFQCAILDCNRSISLCNRHPILAWPVPFKFIIITFKAPSGGSAKISGQRRYHFGSRGNCEQPDGFVDASRFVFLP